MIEKYNILLLGSGLMAESVATYLIQKDKNNRIHIASDIKEHAKAIAERVHNQRCTSGVINVTDQSSLYPLVQNCKVVISYVPAFLHVHVAKACLKAGKHLVTASYVSPEMKELDQQAKKKGLIFLNQLGLDPGIDHLATMKIVNEVYKSGGKILQYQSWCGGLPSPTDCDNPLGYKFTWSPIGAFRALNNKATFLQNNKQTSIQPKDLLYFGAKVQLNQALELQGYPNRNSVPYKQMYQLKDATKVLRGTLRYKGFCDIINAFKQIGISTEIPVKGSTWVQHIQNLLSGEKGKNLIEKILSRCVQNVHHYKKLSKQQKLQKGKRILIAFKFFGLLQKSSKIHDISKNSLQNLIKLLEPKLQLRQGETDLIAMQHRFFIQHKGKYILKKSTLIQIGQKKGFSAMSLTVGTPTAIGAQMILDGKIKERGVIIPIYQDIYNPVLDQLQKFGIKLVDTDQQIQNPKPKL